MEFTDLEKIIKSRRSIRRWQDKEVSKDILLQAIRLATWAPNAGNFQNWYFYIILNRDVISEIADTVDENAKLIASWPEASKFGYEPKASFFRNAPAAIAVTAGQYQSPVAKILLEREKIDPIAAEKRRWFNTANSRIQSISAAIAYLLLILHQMGLGAVWMVGPIQAKGHIEKILHVPLEMDLVAFIPLGYPVESPISERRPVEEISQIIS